MNIKCKQCGIDVFDVTRRRVFCSQSCADANRYIKHPIKIRSKLFLCDYCKKEIMVYPRNIKRKHHFCSRDHQIRYLKKFGFKTSCTICGSLFRTQPAQIKLRNRHTCSKKCFGIERSRYFVNKRIENGLTRHQKDRLLRYCGESYQWRKSVFERDNYTCVWCGEKGKKLEADHIKPFAYFPTLRFELSNGRTLCKKCHNSTKVPAKELRKKHENDPLAVFYDN